MNTQKPISLRWGVIYIAVSTLLIALNIPIGYAQLQPWQSNAQPCVDSELTPDQAKVPCAGIALFSSDVSPQERANIIAQAGSQLRYNYQQANAAAVTINNVTTLRELTSEPSVVRLIPDRPIRALVKPDNPGNGNKDGGNDGQILPSGVERIGAQPGTLTVDGSGIGVAIVDTGLDFSHADLAPATDCFTAYSSCEDTNGHGTHVAGIVAALDNNIDVVGVAPMATLYAVKVLGDRGEGTDSTVMAGLDWIGTHANRLSPPIKVVNMSLGRPGNVNDNPALRALIENLTNGTDPDGNPLRLTVIVAAGNDPTKEVSAMVPATYPEVLAIASSTAKEGNNNRCRVNDTPIPADTASYFTTDGNYNLASGIGVTISAPGAKQEDVSRNCFVRSVGILSLKGGGGTTRASGTSMSAPHVSGVVALMLEKDNSLSANQVRSNIMSSAFRINIAPLNSAISSYTFDGDREGILSACGALSENCP